MTTSRQQFFVKSTDSRKIILWNKQAESISGISSEQSLGKTAHELFPKNIADMFDKLDNEVITSGNIQDIPEEILYKSDSERIIVHTKTVPIFDSNKEPEYLLYISEDITIQKQIQDALRESEEKYRTLLESAHDAIFAVDLSYKFIFMNKIAAKKLGGTPEDFIGKRLQDALPDDIAGELIENINKMIDTGKDYVFENVEIIQGKKYWYNINVQPIMDHLGKITSILFISRDVSKLKESEEKIQQESAKLSAMITGMEEGVLFANADDIIIEANPYFCELLKLKREDVIGKSIWNFHHGATFNVLSEKIQKFRSNPDCEQFSVQRSIMGKQLILRMQPIYRNGKYDGVLLNVIDVTELVNAKREAEEVSYCFDISIRSREKAKFSVGDGYRSTRGG